MRIPLGIFLPGDISIHLNRASSPAGKPLGNSGLTGADLRLSDLPVNPAFDFQRIPRAHSVLTSWLVPTGL